MLNYHVSQKLKMTRKDEFILTLLLNYRTDRQLSVGFLIVMLGTSTRLIWLSLVMFIIMKELVLFTKENARPCLQKM
jgi:hypothetical protein